METHNGELGAAGVVPRSPVRRFSAELSALAQAQAHSSTMPPVPEHLATLDSLLHEGLEALLREAQEKDVLLPPFGRPPLQLPFEEYQAAEEEGSDEDDDEDEDEDGTADGTADGDEGGVPAGPEFAFNYGFNPLMFLAKFLTKNNPVNIAARKLEYEKSTRYLLTIAEHAMLQVPGS